LAGKPIRIARICSLERWFLRIARTRIPIEPWAKISRLEPPLDIGLDHRLGQQRGMRFEEPPQGLCKESIEVRRPSLLDKGERSGGKFIGEFCLNYGHWHEQRLAWKAEKESRICELSGKYNRQLPNPKESGAEGESEGRGQETGASSPF
jgi:hypothetical protein